MSAPKSSNPFSPAASNLYIRPMLRPSSTRMFGIFPSLTSDAAASTSRIPVSFKEMITPFEKVTPLPENPEQVS